MRKPEIKRFREFETGDFMYGLRVPEAWVVMRRFPRLSLCWWLCRMVFRP